MAEEMYELLDFRLCMLEPQVQSQLKHCMAHQHHWECTHRPPKVT